MTRDDYLVGVLLGAAALISWTMLASTLQLT